MKLMEKQFVEEDKIDENESIAKKGFDESNTSVEEAIIVITDSQSPKPSNFVDEDTSYEETASYSRGTRRSTRRGRGNSNTSVLDLPKKRGRKSSLEKGFEKLVEVAKAAKLNAAKYSNLSTVLNDSPLLVDSDEDDTEEIVNVKVVWRHGDPHSFPIAKKKDIGSIFEFFAKQENVCTDNILLSKKDKVLSPHSTPLSIDYKVTDILEGGILQNGTAKPTGSNQQDKDCIEVKVQQKNVKKPLLIQLHKSNDMHILAKKVASELGIDESKLKFNFDGDMLDLDETVESLDLEGGECFDLVVSS